MPIASQLHVDQLLSNVSVAYRNTAFIHDRVFPMVPVKKTSDVYRTYTRAWQIPDTARAVGGVANVHDFAVGTASYRLEKHALKSFVPDTAAENYDITDLRADTTIELTEKIMMRKEKSCADQFLTNTSWSLGVSLAVGDTWLTASANPIPLFDTAVATVMGNAGVKPNYGIIPIASYIPLKNHTTVVDRVKYTSKEINEAIVGALIGLPELLVPNVNYDSGAVGATSVIAAIWKDDFAFVGYKPGAAGFYQLSAGYMFQKAKNLVRRWREEERESEAIELDVEYQFKIVASLAGYYINNTI
jgi:hypothetical protein